MRGARGDTMDTCQDNKGFKGGKSVTVKWILNISGYSTIGGLVPPLGSSFAAIRSPSTMISRVSQSTSASPMSNSRFYSLVKEGVGTHLLWILLTNQHPARPRSDRVPSVTSRPPREMLPEQFPNNEHSLGTLSCWQSEWGLPDRSHGTPPLMTSQSLDDTSSTRS